MGSLRGNKGNWNWAAKNSGRGLGCKIKKFQLEVWLEKKKKKNQVEIPDAKILVEGWGEKKKKSSWRFGSKKFNNIGG